MSDRMMGHALDVSHASPEYRDRLAEHQAFAAKIGRRDVLDGAEHLVYGERQTGKTVLAMRWVLDAPEGVQRALIVRDRQTADHLRHEYELRYDDARVVHVSKLLRDGAEAGVQYGIDETVNILERLLGLTEAPRLLSIGTAAPWQG